MKRSLEKSGLNLDVRVSDSKSDINEIYSKFKTKNKRMAIFVFSDWKTNTFIQSTFDYNLNLLIFNDEGKKLFEISRQAKKKIFAPGEGNPTLNEQIETVINSMFNTPEILKGISSQ